MSTVRTGRSAPAARSPLSGAESVAGRRSAFGVFAVSASGTTAATALARIASSTRTSSVGWGVDTDAGVIGLRRTARLAESLATERYARTSDDNDKGNVVTTLTLVLDYPRHGPPRE